MNAPGGRKRVLIIAYHFPPIKGSSGYLRTLKYVRYLPEFGIDPTVLTVNTRAYEAIDPGLLGQIPPGVHVERSFALDSRRHFGIRGRYPSFLGIPDRICSWIPFGILAGLRLIRERKIDAIFSTYPIPSAHVIGRSLARWSGKPWIADFRDPMWDEYVEVHARGELAAKQRIERAAVEGCAAATVTTGGMRDLFLRRYPGQDPAKFNVISNGYDEADFAGVEPVARDQVGDPDAPVTFVHAGLLDPVDRNPSHFFQALKSLRDGGRLAGRRFRVDLYSPGNPEGVKAELRNLGMEDCVRVLPGVAYGEALRAMARADVLLLFQGPTCENQIPAKLYEYLRIGKPILALTTEAGETGKLVLTTASGMVVPIDDVNRISGAVERCVSCVSEDVTLPAATREKASAYSRRTQAGTLAGLLAGVIR